MIRIGLVGCGHWGPNYLRNFSNIDGVEVVAVCDQREAVLTKLHKQYRDLQTYTDFNDLLSQSGADGIVIATPAHTHYELAQKAFDHGKHVLVEKPLALTVKECLALHEKAKQLHLTLMVGHTFLYNPAIRKMKSYLDSGAIGKIYYLQAIRTHLGLIRDDVNTVWDLAPHDIAIFSYLLGEAPKSVSAVGASHLKPGLEDVAFVNLFFKENVIGHIHISWVDANKSRQVAVIGSKARILFDDLNPLEKIRIYEKGVSLDRGYDSFGEFQLLLRDGDIISPKIEPEEPLRNLCLEFVDCIKTGAQPLADGLNGAQGVETMCAIQESIRMNGKPIDLGVAAL